MKLTLAFGMIVGLSLGLMGGGGLIFAVPLLVFGLGLEFRHAVTLSLAVVGITALYDAILQPRRGHVLWGAGAVLGAGGVVAAPIGAWFLTNLPDHFEHADIHRIDCGAYVSLANGGDALLGFRDGLEPLRCRRGGLLKV